jgi:hypothetical protein
MHIRYFNEHKRLVKNQIADIIEELEKNLLDPTRKQRLEMNKHVYLNSYRHHMIINNFLTMYSHFEECLGVTCQLFSGKMPENKRSGLERFRQHFESEHDVKLSSGPSWSFVCDCAKARHVLLHAAGNVTLARDKKKVEDLIKRNHDYYTTENSRIVPRERLLVKFSEAISEFTEWLTDQVK